MARWKKIALWTGCAIAAPLLMVALLLWTPPGLAVIGDMIGPLSGNSVRITGLGGFFPSGLHADTIEVADAQGVWLRVEQATLDVAILPALSSHYVVHDVSAARIAVLRRPLPSSSEGGETPQIDVDHLSLPRIDLGAPVIGHAVQLSAQGGLHYVSRHQVSADMTVTRVGSSDRYDIHGGIVGDVAQGSAAIREGVDGILGKLAGLPGLGPVNLSAQARGDANANTVALTLTAGLLKAQGKGTISLADSHADLDFTLSAPAMQPRPDIAWQSLSGEAHVHGAFDAPQVRAQLLLAGANLADLKTRQIQMDVSGDAGQVALTGTVDGVVIPGEYPNLFAGAPVTVTAKADLKAATLPVTFAVRHPLLQLTGTAQARGALAVTADVTVPSLKPFADLKNIDMAGRATVHAMVRQDGNRTHLALDTVLDTLGSALPARMLGRNATIKLTADLNGSDISASHVALHGAAVSSDVSGTLNKGVLNYRMAMALSDVSRLAPAVSGTLNLSGSISGALGKAVLSANGAAVLATKGFARQRVGIDLKAEGLPAISQARLALDGRLDGAPLLLHATLDGANTRKANLTVRWRSLDAKGDLTLPQDAGLSGHVTIALGRLADLAAFTGTAIAGELNAALDLKAQGAKTDAVFTADLHNLDAQGVKAVSVSAHGSATDVMGKPILDASADVHQVAAQGFGGDATTHVSGPLSALAITASAKLKDSSGAALDTDATAALDLDTSSVTVTALTGTWRGVDIKLNQPATVSFGKMLSVDHLSAALGGGTLTASGQLMPQLAFKAGARDLPLKSFAAFMPGAGVQGTVSADADLTGTLTAPQGQVSIKGSSLKADFSAAGIPPAALDAKAQLAGDHVILDASLSAGAHLQLRVNGTAPLAADAPMALTAKGTADLALLDPILAANGRRARGTLALDGTVTGTLAAPRINGSGTLSDGELQDYAYGAHLTAIAAHVTAQGTRLVIDSLTAHAGPGTITGSGAVDLAAPGLPVDISLKADNARPIVSDLLTVGINGDLAIKGEIEHSTNVSGKLAITRADINLPDNFPPQVASLNVRRRGQAPPTPRPAQGRILFDIDVRSIGPSFVRGHGVDAEMTGNIHVGGTSAVPALSGDFRMTRGNYTVAGQTLEFTTGRVGFDGAGVRGQLDPSLNFVAQTVSGGVTATLTVTGYASAPKIVLSSSPSLPQDEVVAHLLFQQSVKQLTPLQVASIAQALAAMGGVGGGFNPLGTVRQTLGLDRLAVGSTNGANGAAQTTVEAGRYVANNVYVGVKQNLSGGTQTQVKVDITRRLKAQATLATGTTATATSSNAQQDNGSSVGLSYEFEY